MGVLNKSKGYTFVIALLFSLALSACASLKSEDESKSTTSTEASTKATTEAATEDSTEKKDAQECPPVPEPLSCPAGTTEGQACFDKDPECAAGQCWVCIRGVCKCRAC
jgi:hypothetical protein